jgi:hypothetical protein
MIKVGDRVKFINADAVSGRYYPPVGTHGTVLNIDKKSTSSNKTSIKVQWDSGTMGDGCWYCWDTEVVKAEGFTKADLKTGDFVKLRDGEVGIVNTTCCAITYRTDIGDLHNYNEDLRCRMCHNCDIIAVRRPAIITECTFNIFDSKLGNLIYEREEVEEMTLEQVCKLLGKEIKIVKEK